MTTNQKIVRRDGTMMFLSIYSTKCLPNPRYTNNDSTFHVGPSCRELRIVLIRTLPTHLSIHDRYGHNFAACKQLSQTDKMAKLGDQ